MEDKRNSSAKSSSRRRRWEVKSKESFETSLAVEIESPIITKPQSGGSEFDNKQTVINRQAYMEKSSDILTSFGNTDTVTNDYMSGDESNKDNTDVSDDILSAKLADIINNAEKQQKSPSKDYDTGIESDNTIEEKKLDGFESELFGKSENMNMNPTPSAPLYIDSSSPHKVKQTKRKNKRNSKTAPANLIQGDSIICKQLREIDDDDVIDIPKDKLCNNDIIARPGLLISPSSSSQHKISSIYCEKINGFVISEEQTIVTNQISERLQDVTQNSTRVSHAVFLQTGFRTFSVLCQGLLAGVTLTHCLMIFLLKITEDNLSLTYPPAVCHVFFVLIFLLSSICLVAACDRCDLAGQGVFSGHGIKVPWTPAFYLAGLILTLVAVRTEDYLSHHNLYSPHITDKGDHLIEWWRWMCVARTALSVLAWVAIVPDPHTDALGQRISLLPPK